MAVIDITISAEKLTLEALMEIEFEISMSLKEREVIARAVHRHLLGDAE